jgi:16S rRNA (uracil1498-N3)-methyltransferase
MMRSFFVDPDEFLKAEATISGADARHIRKVLRLKPGARVRITDGQGQLADARIKAVECDRIRIEILTVFNGRSTGLQEMVVAQAMLKDRKMDGVIRALTELGMTTWMPFVSTRSVVQPNQRRFLARQARWARIAREAVKQCGRRRQPRIQITAGLADILLAAHGFDHKIMFWEEAAALPRKPHEDKVPEDQDGVMLIIGPEGGFTAEEAEAARNAGFQLCSLGPRILRAETAALAAVTVAQYLFGDWQRPTRP